MSHTPTPWVGLAALIAMFVIPFLPDWLFEGPRTTEHWPRRHVCGDCGAPWTNGHTCAPKTSAVGYPPLRAELHRPKQPNISPRPLTDRRTGHRSFKGLMRS
jgi:hypothetical protein